MAVLLRAHGHTHTQTTSLFSTPASSFNYLQIMGESCEWIEAVVRRLGSTVSQSLVGIECQLATLTMNSVTSYDNVHDVCTRTMCARHVPYMLEYVCYFFIFFGVYRVPAMANCETDVCDVFIGVKEGLVSYRWV